MKIRLRDVLAVIIGLSAFAGLGLMWTAELNVVPAATFNYEYYMQKVLPGLRQYAGAIGLILLAVSISYILLGSENKIATHADKPEQ